MIPCKICSELTDCKGTKLCNCCWQFLRTTTSYIQQLGSDVQITYEDNEWTVHFRDEDGRIYCSVDPSFEKAFEEATRLKNGE